MSKRYSEADIREATERLKDWLKPGDTVFTIYRHRAASGMTHWISMVKLTHGKDGQPDVLHIDYSVAALLGRGYETRRHEGIEVHGAGMDMGFELVYSLSRKLFDDGYALHHRWL